MPADIQATIAAAQGGLSNVPPAAGADLIQQWEQDLSGLDSPDAADVKRDLASLRQELQSSSPDLAKASQLVKSLGASTTKIGQSAGSEELKSLGQALSQGA